MAQNLLTNANAPNSLNKLMLPWAEAVMEVRREMESDALSRERKQRILTELASHKLRVDFIVVSREGEIEGE